MIMQDIIAFIIALIVHELGHWFYFRFFGYKARFTFGFLGTIEVGREVCHKPTLNQALSIYGMPVILGLIPLLVYDNALVIWMYFFISSADLLQVMQIISFKGDKKKMTMNDMWINMLKDMIKKPAQKL